MPIPHDLNALTILADTNCFYQNSFDPKVEIPHLIQSFLHPCGGMKATWLMGGLLAIGAGWLIFRQLKRLSHRMIQRANESKQLKQKLQTNEKILQNIFDAIQDSICVVDRDLNVLRMNTFLLERTKLYLRKDESPIGQKCYKIYFGQDAPCDPCPVLRCYRSRKTEMQEHEMIRPPDKKIFVDSFAYPVFDEKGEITCAVNYIQDVTYRKQIERDLQKAKTEAEEMHLLKSKLLAHVSHEMRTPLQCVMGFSELLERTPLNFQQRSYLKNIFDQNELILNMLDDVLMLKKLKYGSFKIESNPFDLHELLSNEIRSLQPLAQKSNVDLNLKCAHDLPRHIIGDKLRLKQILTNLLVNGIKFSQGGEVHLTVEVKETCGKRSTLQFTVKDTGLGIQPDQIPYLFQEFSQIHFQQEKGLGLGLAICKKLCLLLGGDIIVKNCNDKGCCFVFHLSFLHAPVGALKKQKNEAKIIVDKNFAITNPLRILIAEDAVMSAEVLQEYFSLFGYQTDLVNNGQEALQAIQSQSYDLALIDLSMPVMDGMEVVREIHRLHECHRPRHMIAITADSSPEKHEECLANGFEDYLVKPIVLSSIRLLLKKITSSCESQPMLKV
ncbi:MAG: ATP-binding protein [Verrucomicrobiota bacterium]